MRWLVGVALLAVGCIAGDPVSAGPITAAELHPGPNGTPPRVAPNRLEPLRIAGEKTILPDEKRISRRASFKFCLDESGRVADVKLLEASGDDQYDAKISATIQQRWAYQPVVVEGKPTAVCSAVTFIYNSR
jgi:TonB family protein